MCMLLKQWQRSLVRLKSEYFTNILGQKFYNKEDLLRNIRDSKARGLSIYSPEFNAQSFGASSSQRKKRQEFDAPSFDVSKKKSEVGEASSGVCKKKKKKSGIRGAKKALKEKEAGQQHEMQGVKIRTQVSHPRNPMFRSSRRVAGLGPELHLDFDFGKGLEYIIKDKP